MSELLSDEAVFKLLFCDLFRQRRSLSLFVLFDDLNGDSATLVDDRRLMNGM